LWVKKWEEMQKHTDIQMPEMDEKLKNIELYKEMLRR
jgi:hypothetical protein